jgi:hypothetical protein
MFEAVKEDTMGKTMKKETPRPPPPPKRDLRERSEAEIAKLEAWLIKLMKGRPME